MKTKRARILLFLLFFALSTILFSYTITAQFQCSTGEHQFVFVYSNPPTEHENGYDKYQCVTCGEESLSILFATGRDWGAWVVLRAPTCTRPGLRRRTCMRHNFHSETGEIPALGHDFVLTEETPPTCTEDGERIYNCSRCGEEHIEPGEPALECEFIREVTKYPSCTENGKITYICKRCDDVSHTKSISSPGHDFGDWNVDIPPQEGIEGNEVRICEFCGYYENRIITALAIPQVVDESYSLFGLADVAIYSFNFLFVLLGAFILFPGMQGIFRLKNIRKKYLRTLGGG